MSDANNLMLYAADKPDGSPGCARWIVVRHTDRAQVIEYVRSVLKNKGNALHDWKTFFAEDLRRRM